MDAKSVVLCEKTTKIPTLPLTDYLLGNFNHHPALHPSHYSFDH